MRSSEKQGRIEKLCACLQASAEVSEFVHPVISKLLTRKIVELNGRNGMAYELDAAIRLISYCDPDGSAHLLIDKYLSNYDVRDHHETFVAAEPAQAYQVLRSMDFHRSLLVRTLFALRNLPARFWRRNNLAPTKKPNQPFLDFALSIGWKILEEIPGQELVCGAVTKPWEANVKFQGMSGPELIAFAEPGFTKIVWNMAVIPEAEKRCRIVLETRVAATDHKSRRQFKKYWFVFGPFIGLIRRSILRLLKRDLKRMQG